MEVQRSIICDNSCKSSLPIFLMAENTGNALARCMLKGLDNDLRRKNLAVVCGVSNNGGGGPQLMPPWRCLWFYCEIYRMSYSDS